ncbi:MAG: O-antigen ligase family protein [Mucilaginibacter sp.]|nr:O-antigen ligase family protein [Mucilaginibacter sp.]
MKKLFLINDSIANKVSYFHVMLLLLSLPFDRFYSHLILISITIHTLINLNKKDIKPVFTLTNLMLQSVFFVTVIGTLYTINKTQAFNEWSRQVVILLVPIIFCLNALDLKKYRDNLLLVFALGCTATILYLYIQVFITIKYYHLPVSAVFSSAFTNHNFSEPIDMHATFFSMQIAVALVYLLYALVKETAIAQKTLYAFCCFVLMGGILQLSSKSVFAGLLIIVNVALPYFLLTGRAKIKYITVAASISALVITSIYSIDNFKSHYITDLQKDLSKASANELTDPRLARWGVALQLAAQAPIVGHGSGSEIQLLKERFFQHKFYRSYLHGLNAHNQFISFIIKTGIWGALVYLAILFFGFRMAISKNDLLLFSFMVIITVVSFSENYLDVDKGVFFYSVFFSLFMFSQIQATNKDVATS